MLVSSWSSHFGHDVNAAEQQLVQVAAPHQLRAVDEGVLEAGPDSGPQVGRDVQLPAQIPQTHAGQVVHLQTRPREEERVSARRKALAAHLVGF